MMNKITDCGPDGGCEECDVCRYLNFIEWAGQVSGGVPSHIEHDVGMDVYLRMTYPHAFPNNTEIPPPARPLCGSLGDEM